MEAHMIIMPGTTAVSRPLGVFDRLAKTVEYGTGHPIAFWTATSLVAGWAATGSWYQYSDSWQLVINTTTTIITFLMVFVIQTNQNRASAAVQLKLDEIIRAHSGAHNALLASDDLTLEEIEELRTHYEQLAVKARSTVRQGQADTGTPDIVIG